MRKLIFLLSAIAIPVIFNSCSKKTEEITRSVLLATSTWKYSEAGIDPDGDGKIDSPIPASIPILPCSTDFILTFKSDKTGTLDEGPTKCQASDPQTSSFTWDLSADNSELILPANLFTQLPGFGGNVKIVELTATKLVLFKNVSVTGVPFPIGATIVLVH